MARLPSTSKMPPAEMRLQTRRDDSARVIRVHMLHEEEE